MEAKDAQRSSARPKLGALIAEAIETDIIGAGWPVGSVLATEAELVTRFGVSRATVREAVGQLERRGLAAMKAGKNGGLVVTAPARDATIRALSTYMELAAASVENILRVRLLLEQQAALLASERITDAEVVALRAQAERLHHRTGRIEEDAQAHHDIRRLIATASRNPILSLFIEALSVSALDVIFTQVDRSDTVRDAIERASAIKARLVEAIISVDRYEAQRLIREDVEIQIAGYRGLKLGNPATVAPDWSGGGRKLPQRLAMQISQRILIERLAPGDHLGSEPELLKALGVGRSALREALRMLESYSVVRMRRGFGGGLTVGTPDPGPTIASAVRFLRSMGAEWRDLFEVREALELGAVRSAARLASPAQLAGLRAAYDAETALPPGENPVPLLTDVHKRISSTGGNPILELFTCVVIDTTAASYSGPPSEGVVRLVKQSHRAIIEAIIDHDESLARRRMFNHIQLLGRIGHDPSRIFGDAHGLATGDDARTGIHGHG